MTSPSSPFCARQTVSATGSRRSVASSASASSSLRRSSCSCSWSCSPRPACSSAGASVNSPPWPRTARQCWSPRARGSSPSIVTGSWSSPTRRRPGSSASRTMTSPGALCAPCCHRTACRPTARCPRGSTSTRHLRATTRSCASATAPLSRSPSRCRPLARGMGRWSSRSRTSRAGVGRRVARGGAGRVAHDQGRIGPSRDPRAARARGRDTPHRRDRRSRWRLPPCRGRSTRHDGHRHRRRRGQRARRRSPRGVSACRPGHVRSV